MLYFEVVPGDKIEVTVAPKGFGSENMSKIAMLRPSDGLQGVKDFIIKTVGEAGPNPCPPIVVGVGIGGTFDKAAYLAKKALIRPVNVPNEDSFYANLEEELLEEINKLGIRLGDRPFYTFFMAKGGKYSVSDWLHKTNQLIKRNYVW